MPRLPYLGLIELIDFTINLPTILSGGTALVVLVAWFVRLEGRTTDNQKNTDTLNKTLAALEELVSLHQQQFQEYRLESAEKYVTQAAMTEIKRDLIGEMKAMEGRVEATISRAIRGQA